MAGIATEPAGLDEQRAELKAVLESEEFKRAPTLIRLLSYLCEKVFAGEANSIKEYSVGVEVFGRGTSFDPDTDSIVRVEANRLRKRIADYYAASGASHRLRILIPVGQYIPHLERQNKPFSDAPLHRAANLPIVPSIGSPALSLRRMAWALAFVLAMAAASAGIWFALRPANPSSAASPLQEPLESVPTLQVGPPAGEEIRILAGGSRSLVDHAGKLWNADAWFSGGDAVHSSVQQIWRTQEPGFYRNSRQGRFRYDIPLKRAVYELRLHFAETTYGPELAGAGGEGSRLFTVRANEQTLVSGLDVVADASGSRTADVKVFPGIRPASDGKLHLDFAGEDGSQAILSAIEIVPGLPNRMRPVRILARPSPYYSNDSRWWSPDDYFEGGQLSSYVTPVTGTDDPELFESERWGNFSYAIPVAPGKYTATLYFAFRRAPADGRPANSAKKLTPSARVFNLFCNGRALLQDFDLAKEARLNDVVVRQFANLVPNAQGKLLLSFVPAAGYAAVSGIEVVAQ